MWGIKCRSEKGAEGLGSCTRRETHTAQEWLGRVWSSSKAGEAVRLRRNKAMKPDEKSGENGSAGEPEWNSPESQS